jgi:hypothetical protein
MNEVSAPGAGRASKKRFLLLFQANKHIRDQRFRGTAKKMAENLFFVYEICRIVY